MPSPGSHVDVDVAVADDAGAESTTRQLAELGHRVTALVEQESAGRLSMARLARGFGRGRDLRAALAELTGP